LKHDDSLCICLKQSSRKISGFMKHSGSQESAHNEKTVPVEVSSYSSAQHEINIQGSGGTQFLPRGATRLSHFLCEHLPLGVSLLLAPALLRRLGKWYVCRSSNFSLFFSSLLLPFPLSSRNLLHHFTVHVRGWNQL